MKWFLSSKIHKAIVTDADVNYVGSITIDEEIMSFAGIQEGEKVMVVSNSTGSRLETYVIKGKFGGRQICMNGAAAHLIKKGEEIIIMGFILSAEPIISKQILLSKLNSVIQDLKSTGCIN